MQFSGRDPRRNAAGNVLREGTDACSWPDGEQLPILRVRVKDAVANRKIFTLTPIIAPVTPYRCSLR